MKVPQLLHYSDTPLTKVVSREQGDDPLKPNGLWCSVGVEWEEWCRAAEFGLARLAVVHEITLAREANLLHLSSASALDRFTQEFRLTQAERFPAFYTKHYGLVDWGRVATRYGGILIEPYCWQRRLSYSTHWYYGWDCASACIWDARQIAEVRLFKRADAGESLQ